MVVKDRLSALQASAPADEDTALVVDDQVEQVDHGACMDDFFEKTTKIKDLLEQLERTADAVSRKQSEILSAPSTDTKVMKAELDELNATAKGLANKIRAKLKAMEAETEAEAAKGHIYSAHRIRQNHHAGMSRQFVQAMTEYNLLQTTYKEKCKERLRRQIKIADKEVAEEELDAMLESGNMAVFAQGIISPNDQAQQTLAEIQARHDDIVKLEQSIAELSEMFMDMAMLVESQGDIIDGIEKNVGEAKDYVRDGKDEVEHAHEYQRKAQKKKIILMVIIIVVVVIIVSIVLAKVVP